MKEEEEWGNASSLGTIGTPPDSEEYLSGTSMSAPHTTGTAALAAGEFPGLLERPTALKRLVMATGQPAPLTRGQTVTGDIVNAGNAVTDTAPRISNLSPTGVVSDSTPKIQASVVDLQEMLPKPDVDFFVDGVPRTNFSYNANSGALSFTSAMKEGRHSVKITATDPQGNRTTRAWTFRVN